MEETKEGVSAALGAMTWRGMYDSRGGRGLGEQTQGAVAGYRWQARSRFVRSLCARELGTTTAIGLNSCCRGGQAEVHFVAAVTRARAAHRRPTRYTGNLTRETRALGSQKSQYVRLPRLRGLFQRGSSRASSMLHQSD